MGKDVETGAPWRSDPVVRFEKAVYPALLAVMRDLWRGTPLAARALAELSTTIGEANDRLLAPKGVGLDKAAVARMRGIAAELSAHARDLSDAGEGAPSGELADALPGLVEEATDIVRSGYIDTVIARQSRDARNAHLAARELEAIRRQIYFIAINATVEAARAGEAGIAFGAIGRQVRELAEATKLALERLDRPAAK